MKEKGLAILNFDDGTVLEMGDKLKTRVTNYGFGEGAEIRGAHYKILSSASKRDPISAFGKGITFKVDYKGKSVPIRVLNTFGKQQVYNCLAAVGVGVEFGINLIKISEALNMRYFSPQGRLKLIEGVKGSCIIDDTYNASPIATATTTTKIAVFVFMFLILFLLKPLNFILTFKQ